MPSEFFESANEGPSVSYGVIIAYLSSVIDSYNDLDKNSSRELG
jgi:hypothetical protein